MNFPARVHIILARESPTAIAIRRGPSKSVCTLLWDRQHDTFTLGQWFRGRIYERRCDLSPDGKHFIYFAMNGKWDSEAKGSWTAISRAPYLKALGLWANGSGWHGGGLFMTNKSYWLNESIVPQEGVSSPKGFSRHGAYPFHEQYGGECPGVYYVRLQRDGWNLIERGGPDFDSQSVFHKELPGGWQLRKVCRETIDHPAGTGCYFDTHSLNHLETGQTIEGPDWEWADWDRHRLAWVAKGILYVGSLTETGLRDTKSLHDFNAMKFEAIPAPY
jgi:hypothetical protein